MFSACVNRGSRWPNSSFERHKPAQTVSGFCAKIVDETNAFSTNFVFFNHPGASTTILTLRGLRRAQFLSFIIRQSCPLLFPSEPDAASFGSCPRGALWPLLSQGKGAIKPPWSWILRPISTTRGIWANAICKRRAQTCHTAVHMQGVSVTRRLQGWPDRRTADAISDASPMRPAVDLAPIDSAFCVVGHLSFQLPW